MLLRQVQARPLQGHHLRALRRRGDAAEELGIDLSPGSLRAVGRQPTAEEAEEGQERVDQDGELALPNDEALGDLTDVDVSTEGATSDGDADDEEEAPALAAEPELELED